MGDKISKTGDRKGDNMGRSTVSLGIEACGGDRSERLRIIAAWLTSSIKCSVIVGSVRQLHEARVMAEQLKIIASELDEAKAKPPATVGAAAVCSVTVTDPDSGLPVEVEIYKLATGGMVGVDGSWLAADEGPTYSPFDCVDGHPVELDFGDEH
jgi:hypothetical protein